MKSVSLTLVFAGFLFTAFNANAQTIGWKDKCAVKAAEFVVETSGSMIGVEPFFAHRISDNKYCVAFRMDGSHGGKSIVDAVVHLDADSCTPKYVERVTERTHVSGDTECRLEPL